jgi:hypothetical protein
MKYRMLRKNEKPDKAKGDEYQWHGDRWAITSLRGKCMVSECNRSGNSCVYRRPAKQQHDGR